MNNVQHSQLEAARRTVTAKIGALLEASERATGTEADQLFDAAARLRTLRGKLALFSFDDDEPFAAFDLGGSWNGFWNVAVTAEAMAEIRARLGEHDEESGLGEIAPNALGLYSLAGGFTSQPWTPPEPTAPATIFHTLAVGDRVRLEDFDDDQRATVVSLTPFEVEAPHGDTLRICGAEISGVEHAGEFVPVGAWHHSGEVAELVARTPSTERAPDCICGEDMGEHEGPGGKVFDACPEKLYWATVFAAIAVADPDQGHNPNVCPVCGTTTLATAEGATIGKLQTIGADIVQVARECGRCPARWTVREYFEDGGLVRTHVIPLPYVAEQIWVVTSDSEADQDEGVERFDSWPAAIACADRVARDNDDGSGTRVFCNCGDRRVFEFFTGYALELFDADEDAAQRGEFGCHEDDEFHDAGAVIKGKTGTVDERDAVAALLASAGGTFVGRKSLGLPTPACDARTRYEFGNEWSDEIHAAGDGTFRRSRGGVGGTSAKTCYASDEVARTFMVADFLAKLRSKHGATARRLVAGVIGFPVEHDGEVIGRIASGAEIWVGDAETSIDDARRERVDRLDFILNSTTYALVVFFCERTQVHPSAVLAYSTDPGTIQLVAWNADLGRFDARDAEPEDDRDDCGGRVDVAAPHPIDPPGMELKTAPPASSIESHDAGRRSAAIRVVAELDTIRRRSTTDDREGHSLWLAADLVRQSYGLPPPARDDTPEGFETGCRVRIRQAFDRFPHFTVPAGLLGTVIECGPDLVSVRLDVTLSGAAEWKNEVHFYPKNDGPDGDKPAEYLERFRQADSDMTAVAFDPEVPEDLCLAIDRATADAIAAANSAADRPWVSQPYLFTE